MHPEMLGRYGDLRKLFVRSKIAEGLTAGSVTCDAGNGEQEKGYSRYKLCSTQMDISCYFRCFEAGGTGSELAGRYSLK